MTFLSVAALPPDINNFPALQPNRKIESDARDKPAAAANVSLIGNQNRLETLNEAGNQKLLELHNLIVTALYEAEDKRTISEMIRDTFEVINQRETKKLEEFQVRQTDRQGAIEDISQLHGVVLTQQQDGKMDLSAPFTLAEYSPMRIDGWSNPTVSEVMTYYRDNHKELGLPSPPANISRLESYAKTLSTALAGVLTTASQQSLFDLQEQLQHMHAMRDLQSALTKSVGDVWGTTIKGM